MGQPNDNHNSGFSDRCWVPQMSGGTISGKVDAPLQKILGSNPTQAKIVSIKISS